MNAKNRDRVACALVWACVAVWVIVALYGRDIEALVRAWRIG